jgi:SAM-dependent methyltransferase
LGNDGLKAKYDEMHKQGASAWFSDGREERETILKMAPRIGRKVLEIGCGEGDLCILLRRRFTHVVGIDYSKKAIQKARRNYRIKDLFQAGLIFRCMEYFELNDEFDCLVMQGVLEHLDDPFGELQWMIEHFKPRTVITSSPCFLNTRGVVWMTLNMLGAVMSKTDLHYLNPWDFEIFCEDNGYKLTMQDCDWEWGNGGPMIEDLTQRIPLALKDGGLPDGRVDDLMEWLKQIPGECRLGATMVYRIDV